MRIMLCLDSPSGNETKLDNVLVNHIFWSATKTMSSSAPALGQGPPCMVYFGSGFLLKKFEALASQQLVQRIRTCESSQRIRSALTPLANPGLRYSKRKWLVSVSIRIAIPSTFEKD